MAEIEIVSSSSKKEARTVGLRTVSHPEIVIFYGHDELADDAMDFLEILAAYVLDGHSLRDCEKVAHGFWNTQVRQDKEVLDVWEVTLDGEEWQRGGLATLRFWQEQHAVCDRYDATFIQTRADDFIAVSTGVLDGLTVGGVRYAETKPHSGWYLTTSAYSGEISTMIVVHAFHLAEVRPDIVPYLALPAGFRFSVDSQHGHAWFDLAVPE